MKVHHVQLVGFKRQPVHPYTTDDELCGTCEQPAAAATLAEQWSHQARRCCDWGAIHPALDVAHPRGGMVPSDRGDRKREQILNMSLFVAPLIAHQPDAVVVDFCCGGAHQSLPLAAIFPEATFVLVDLKRRSLDVAEARVRACGLRNVRIITVGLHNWPSDCSTMYD